MGFYYAVVFYVMLGVPGSYVYDELFDSFEECKNLAVEVIHPMDEYFTQNPELYPETLITTVCIKKEFNSLNDG